VCLFLILCTVPCNTMFGSQHQMDIALLDKLIREDVETGKLPLLLIANAGTPGAGHTDKLGRLKELCEQYGMWLHIEGVNLATLALWEVSSPVMAATRSDSMTLTLGPWLGLPAVPAVTLYRHEDPALSLAAGLTSSQPVEKLRALPLWLSLQYLGQDGIVEKIRHAVELVSTLESSGGSVEGYFAGEREVLDSLNRWLCERLAQLVPASGVDIVELEDEGTCVRFTPLMTAAALGTQRCDVDLLVERLIELVPVLNCTLRLRLDFREEVYRHSALSYIEDLNWPGLGAVRKLEVEKINSELLVKLGELDADLIFSTGLEFGPEKDCIFIGMATEDLDVAELVDTIAALGRDIEENGRLLENMTEVVRKGIQEAELQLQKDNQDKLMEEGVLRQIPLVGSVLNWFSPFQSTVKGRTFNLAAGSLDSTEPTYSMKAQTGGLASPETPTSSAKRLPGQRLFRREGAGGSDSHSETSSVGQAEDFSRERFPQPTPPSPVPDEAVSVVPESPETPQVPAEPEPTQENGEVGTQEEERQPDGQDAPVEETGR
uniref:Pyridoxal-dependent decarboxylase domain-containing protein 1 n=1 Tax=Oncorhynchus tshawytscha TaxID=74940 RepID=A0A8C8CYU3_ONCTS